MATEADIHFPWDAVDPENPTEDETVDEGKWRRMFRAWAGSGVRAGVANELEGFADSTGRQVKLRTGEISIESHVGVNSSEKTLAVTTNVSGSPRLDLLVARADFVDNVIEWDVIAGTPAGSPAYPSLTQDSSTWEVPIAGIGPLASGYSTIAAGSVTDFRGFLSPYSVPTYASSAARDLWVPSPESGYAAWLRDTDFLSTYDGSAWSDADWDTWTPTYGGTVTVGSATVVALYKLEGRICHVQLRFVTHSTTSFGGSPITVSLPVTAATVTNLQQHLSAKFFDNDLDNNYFGVGLIGSGGSSMTLQATDNVTSSHPFSWNGAQADEFAIWGTYYTA